MNDSSVGTIFYDVSIDTSKLSGQLKGAESQVKSSLKNQEKSAQSSSSNMEKSFYGVAGSLMAVGAGYISLRGVTGFLKQATADANAYQASVAGLASVSRAFGVDQNLALQSAKALSADGLIPLAQSTQAFKNALSSGFSLEEATMLLSGLKDQAVNNRQSFYDLGGAVVATTEGIRNGNSVLADATGTTKNLSVMAKEAGISVDQMGSINQNAGYRTAVLNGFLSDSARSMGDSARYAETSAGAQARLNTQMQYLRISVGQITNAISRGLVGSLGQFIGENQRSIISLGAGIATFITVATTVFYASKAIRTLITAIRAMTMAQAIATGGLSLLATALGAIAAIGVGELFDEFAGMDNSTENIAGNMATMPQSMGDTGKEAKNLAKELAKIDDEIQKTNASFKEQLAELVQTKNESIKTLREQLAEEDKAYAKSYQDRIYDFNKTQKEEADEHAMKTKALQTQIDFLSRYNTQANRRRLSELQFSLTRENSEYSKKFAERQAKYDLDAQYEADSYEARRLELQTKLNAEMALLEKHRMDVLAVRDVILLDEIEKLKRTRDEQLASLNQQKADAISNANSVSAGVGGAYGNMAENIKRMNQEMTDRLKNQMNDFGNNSISIFDRILAKIASIVPGFDQLKRGYQDLAKVESKIEGIRQQLREATARGDKKRTAELIRELYMAEGRAKGGSVSANTPYLVGENSDGSINKTTELFVPNRSGTIVPSGDLQSMISSNGGGGGLTIQVEVNKLVTSSPAEERALAFRLGERIAEVMRAQGKVGGVA